MPTLIDCHSHFFSRVFFETLAAASPRPGTAEERLGRVVRETGLELPAASVEEHLARWTAELDRYGVEHLVSFASVPQEADAVAEAVALAGGRLSGLLVVDPSAPEASEQLAARMDESGFRGALLFPAMHRYPLDGPACADVFTVLNERAGLAVVHCGLLKVALRDRFGLPRGYDLRLANPLALVPAADANPDVRFIVPHFGGGFLDEVLLAGAQCTNLFVDTSSSNGWMFAKAQPMTLVDVFERCLGVFGPERILFGTDSSVFPRGWRHDILLVQREALGAIGVSQGDKEKILGGNAATVLGLRGGRPT